MLKLTKTKPSEWNGNGFGNSNSEWVVKDYPDIKITKSSYCWNAYRNDLRIARGFTRTELLEILEFKLNKQ